jgi:hypothetical protein
MKITLYHHHHHHHVPCLQTLAVMYLHPFLSLVLFIISVIDFTSSQFARPSKIFSRCQPLSLLPEILPVTIVCSNWSFRVICPKKSDCLLLISLIKDLSTFACCNMTSFDIFAVHGTFNILLRNHMSVASSCLFTFLFIVQISLP